MLTIKEKKLILQWNEKRKTQQEIAELLDCNQSSISRFLRRYKVRKTLDNLPKSGRPTKLTAATKLKLKEEIVTKIKEANNQYSALSTKEVGKIIHQEIGEIYTLRHVERIMHKLGFSLIKPRSQVEKTPVKLI
ncbi:MAG TPA: winged helix-turn-helix domain-containing protein [Candidatus Nanoarchaeia archaeon]|nr:winged helix-turn-helix domain-containing protein [Candidatus Nanoarchaeia archaeon]